MAKTYIIKKREAYVEGIKDHDNKTLIRMDNIEIAKNPNETKPILPSWDKVQQAITNSIVSGATNVGQEVIDGGTADFSPIEEAEVQARYKGGGIVINGVTYQETKNPFKDGMVFTSALNDKSTGKIIVSNEFRFDNGVLKQNSFESNLFKVSATILEEGAKVALKKADKTEVILTDGTNDMGVGYFPKNAKSVVVKDILDSELTIKQRELDNHDSRLDALEKSGVGGNVLTAQIDASVGSNFSAAGELQLPALGTNGEAFNYTAGASFNYIEFFNATPDTGAKVPATVGDTNADYTGLPDHDDITFKVDTNGLITLKSKKNKTTDFSVFGVGKVQQFTFKPYVSLVNKSDLSKKQDTIDNAIQGVNKSIVGAINENKNKLDTLVQLKGTTLMDTKSFDKLSQGTRIKFDFTRYPDLQKGFINSEQFKLYLNGGLLNSREDFSVAERDKLEKNGVAWQYEFHNGGNGIVEIEVNFNLNYSPEDPAIVLTGELMQKSNVQQSAGAGLFGDGTGTKTQTSAAYSKAESDAKYSLKGSGGSGTKIITTIAQKDIFTAAPKEGNEVIAVVDNPQGGKDIYKFLNKEVIANGNQSIYDVYKSHFIGTKHTTEKFWTEASSTGISDVVMGEYKKLDKTATGNEITLWKSVAQKIFNLNEDQPGIRKLSVTNKAENKFLTHFIDDGQDGEVKFEAFDGKTRVSMGVLQNQVGTLEDGFRDSKGQFTGLKEIHQATLDSSLAKTIAERNEKSITQINTDLVPVENDVNLLKDAIKVSTTSPGKSPERVYIQADKSISVSKDPVGATDIATRHYVDSVVNHNTGGTKRVADEILLDEQKNIKVSKNTTTVTGQTVLDNTTVPYTSTKDLSKATHLVFKVRIQYTSSAGDLYDEFAYPNYRKIGNNWECSNGEIWEAKAYSNKKVQSEGIIDFGDADINTNNKEAFLNFGQGTDIPKGADSGEWFVTIDQFQVIEESAGGGSGVVNSYTKQESDAKYAEIKHAFTLGFDNVSDRERTLSSIDNTAQIGLNVEDDSATDSGATITLGAANDKVGTIANEKTKGPLLRFEDTANNVTKETTFEKIIDTVNAGGSGGGGTKWLVLDDVQNKTWDELKAVFGDDADNYERYVGKRIKLHFGASGGFGGSITAGVLQRNYSVQPTSPNNPFLYAASPNGTSPGEFFASKMTWVGFMLDSASYKTIKYDRNQTASPNTDKVIKIELEV